MSSLEAGIRRWDDEEHRLLNLAAEADRLAELISEDDRLHIAALLVTARREARESKERVAELLTRVAGDA